MEVRLQASNDALRKLKGKKFDEAFLKQIIEDHVAMIGLFNTESLVVADKDLNDWVVKSQPVLQKNLEKARDLVAKIAKEKY